MTDCICRIGEGPQEDCPVHGRDLSQGGDDEHVDFFREVVELQKAAKISAPHMHGMLAAYDGLLAALKKFDPDPIVCGCREANCPHTAIAKLPRQALVDHYKERIRILTSEREQLFKKSADSSRDIEYLRGLIRDLFHAWSMATSLPEARLDQVMAELSKK